MIMYFTGTGNSRFVADYLAEKLNDTTLSLNNILKNDKTLLCTSDKPYILVAPIYAWRFPYQIENLIKDSELKGNNIIYCIATMGENSGNADKYIEKIFTDKGMNFKGFTGVAMQNNYLLMEVMPDETAVHSQFPAIVNKLDVIAAKIIHGDLLSKDDKTPLPSLMSGIVNWGFNNFMLKNQKYTVNEKCILCGKCVGLCPTNNISQKEGTICFDNRCMACFSCLHNCPLQAINIAGKTENKGRYICPEYSQWKLHN